MLRKSLFYPLFFVSVLLSSCEFKCSVGDSGTAEEPKTKPVEKDGAALYNGIQVETRNVKLRKAYLATRDKGDRIGEGNFVDVKEGVKLIIMGSEGWKEENGKVLLGASMQVTADTGEMMLDEQDMFASYGDEGISVRDSKILALSVFFNKLEAARPVSFQVRFKVWDKRSDAFIAGNYTIHSK
jgi:hypothetical protein